MTVLFVISKQFDRNNRKQGTDVTASTLLFCKISD